MELTKLEKYLIEQENLVADDNFVSDGFILIAKELIYNPVLKSYKTTNKNIMENIPFNKGTDLPNFAKVGTQCKLLPLNQIGLCIGNNNYISYYFVSLFESHIYKYINYTMQDYNTGYLIKLFVTNKFAGCIMSIKKED